MEAREHILNKLIELDGKSRSKFDLLAIYVKKYGAKDVLVKYFPVVEEAFGLIYVIPHPAKILKFITEILKFVSISTCSTFDSIKYRLYELVIQGVFSDKTRKMVGESILVPLFKQFKGVFNVFRNGNVLGAHNLELEKYKTHGKYLYAQLTLIKAAHACNMSDEFTKSEYYVKEILRPVLRSQDLTLRIDGWTILTKNAKKLADFSIEELGLIKEALSIDLNNQNQNYRSDFFAGTKKAFSRLTAVIYALHRDISRKEKYFSEFGHDNEEMSNLSREKLKLQEKTEFLSWVHKFMVCKYSRLIARSSLFSQVPVFNVALQLWNLYR